MIYLKQNDTGVGIEATLENESGAIDLTDATVLFLMGEHEIQAQITDPVNGVVLVPFQQTHTTSPGVYKSEFEVSFSDGRFETFPKRGYEFVNISKHLGGR